MSLIIRKFSKSALLAISLLGFSTLAFAANDAAISIETCEQLQGIGTTTGDFSDSYVQVTDIDCSHIDNFMPIGGSTSNRHKIVNMTAIYICHLDIAITEITCCGSYPLQLFAGFNGNCRVIGSKSEGRKP